MSAVCGAVSFLALLLLVLLVSVVAVVVVEVVEVWLPLLLLPGLLLWDVPVPQLVVLFPPASGLSDAERARAAQFWAKVATADASCSPR